MFKLLKRTLQRGPFTEPLAEETEASGIRRLTHRPPPWGRSMGLRTVDAGSCNGCELEIQALLNPVYDVERWGFRFTASPRHADVLLVTGPATVNMTEALQRAHDAAPNPKWVVAAGDCALHGGPFKESPACQGGIHAVLPVDVAIPGCPPTPEALCQGLLALLERDQKE
ncbi:MAG: NADH-quinone oxidoreductase subunit NuoB [Magnetococcales bacterium]|nr:NADH-quinone oxidoreductase subunit NuoB [Magnetococcales bacterium]